VTPVGLALLAWDRYFGAGRTFSPAGRTAAGTAAPTRNTRRGASASHTMSAITRFRRQLVAVQNA